MDKQTRDRMDELVQDILKLANDVSGRAHEVADKVPQVPIRGDDRPNA